VFGIRAEKLHADRAFNLVEVEIFAGALVAAKNPFGGNEFGRENVGAVFFAELPEDFAETPAMGARYSGKPSENQGQGRVH